VLGRNHDAPGLRERLHGDEREDPHGAGTDDEHGVLGLDVRAERSMDRTRERLQQDGRSIVHPVGNGPDLRTVGEHHPAPPTTGVGAVAGL
jgi:hypothetical protein